MEKLLRSNQELMFLNQYGSQKSIGVTTPWLLNHISTNIRDQEQDGTGLGEDNKLTTLGRDWKGSSKKTKKSGVKDAIRLGGIPAFKQPPGAAGKNRKGSKKKKKNKKGGFYGRCPNCGYN